MQGRENSESEMCSNLHSPPEVHNTSDCSGRTVGDARADAGIGVSQILMVERIKGIPLDFQMNSLRDGESLR